MREGGRGRSNGKRERERLGREGEGEVKEGGRGRGEGRRERKRLGGKERER